MSMGSEVLYVLVDGDSVHEFSPVGFEPMAYMYLSECVWLVPGTDTEDPLTDARPLPYVQLIGRISRK